MEDNFQHRQDLVKPDESLSKSNKEHLSEDERPSRQHSGIGPRTKDGKNDKRQHTIETSFVVAHSDPLIE